MIAEGAFQIPAGDAGVFASDAFRACAFPACDGFHDPAVMLNGNQKKLVRLRGDVVAPLVGARRC